MFRDLIKFTKIYKRENKQILEYFHTCMDDINESNLFMLRKVCMYISVTYVSMIVIATIILDGFKLNIAHIMVFPLLGIFFFFNLYTKHGTKKLSTTMVGVTCCAFYFSLAVIFVFIDIFAAERAQVFWFSMLVIVFPTVYIDRMYNYGIDELIAIIIFGLVDYNLESKEVFLRNIYLLIASYVVSMLVVHMVLEMRSRECLYSREIMKFSSLDKLTHVLNKGVWVERMEEYFIGKGPEEPCAICIIDLDNFKDVNDNLGHGAGDMVLERVGQLLIDNFRAYDVIGRYGGDEFVVLMPRMGDSAILKMRCRTMQMFLTDFNLGASSNFSVSIGAVIDHGGNDYQRVFEMADDALYKSKLEGKNRCTAWTIENEPFENPILLSVREKDTEEVRRLYAAEGNRFDIVAAFNNDDALRMISQYHRQIKIIILEINVEHNLGEIVLKYIKTRQGFAKLPVLAVAMDQEASFLAHDLGADEVIMKDSSDEEYKRIINQLIRV